MLDGQDFSKFKLFHFQAFFLLLPFLGLNK